MTDELIPRGNLEGDENDWLSEQSLEYNHPDEWYFGRFPLEPVDKPSKYPMYYYDRYHNKRSLKTNEIIKEK